MEGIRRDGFVRDLPARFRTRDGRELDVLLFSRLMAPGEKYILSLTQDVSERRQASEQRTRLEDQLRQAQKMEAIGQLAGGVSHDFNNILMVILGRTEMALDTLPADSPIRAGIEEVHKAGERAAALTRQLLAFSRRQVLRPRVIDLNQTVRGLEIMLRRLVGEDVEIALQTEPALPPVRADPGQIEQVLMNLAVNARDALPQGGRISIETANVSPGPFVMLAVADNGVGMDEKTQARIFEPFFTTKEKGRGTGLGLSMVLGIVQQSGGNIEVESAPTKGTTFRVYLPRAASADEKAQPPSPYPSSLRGTETLLLVEDDEQVRASARAMLHRNGYRVLEAQNAGEAFLVCEQFAEPIHVLLSDVVMPRMSGFQMAERLVTLRPQMKMLFMSGYTDTSPPPGAREAAGGPRAQEEPYAHGVGRYR